MSLKHKQTAVLALSLAILAITAALALAQPARRAHRTGRQEPTAKHDIQFMDVRLFGFEHMEWVPSSFARADGPNTTVDSTDAQTGGHSRLRTPHLYAAGDPKTGKATRVDATGGVKYDGQRPLEGGKGTQVVQFSGAKGTWFRSEGRLVLDGPVNYYGEQPLPENAKEWVRGTADRATYHEEKHLLILDGSVRFTVFVPSLNDKPQPPAETDRLTVDMSKSPYTYTLEGGAVSGTLKPKPKEEKKKP